MKRSCKNCKKSFETENLRKIYCSDACKVEAYRKRNGIQAPTFIKEYKDKRATSPIPSKKEIAEVALVQVKEDKQYNDLKSDEKAIETNLQLLDHKKSLLLDKFNELSHHRSQLDTFQQAKELTDGIFSLLGSSANSTNIGIASTIMGGIFAYNDKKNYSVVNRKRVLKLREVEQQLKEIDSLINGLLIQQINIKARIAGIEVNKRKEIEEKALKQVQAPAVVKIKDEITPVMSLSKLKGMNFDNYEFSDGFQNAIGHPEKNFKMMIYGESGNGKSSYAIEFSNYLATNHGSVLYNSSEEGISLTLKRKLQKYDSDNFSISSCKDYRSLKKVVSKSDYNFIVIDSVNDMNLTSKDLKDLYSLNPDKAFILILQATKGGQYKGSTEIAHDCDIILKIEKYQPIVEKTRYR